MNDSAFASKIADWKPADELPDFGDPIIFPVLSQRLIDEIEPQASRRAFTPGEMLFAHGMRNAPFFVVTAGRVVFFDRNQARQSNTWFSQVTTGMFIGDTSMFTGAPTVAECRAIEPTRVLELTHAQLLELIRTNSELSDIILRTLMARRAWLEGHGIGALQLIGPPECPNTLHLREFLDRNQIPFNWRSTVDDPEVAQLVGGFGVCSEDFPVLTTAKGVHRNPSLRDVATCIGLMPELEEAPYDIAIIGAGPGGLAAAVYAASEGLKTLLLDSVAPGGQAGTSSKIENYLGFTTGISGRDLARQAVLQARKFNATISNPVRVTGIDCQGPYKELHIDSGQVVRARTVVLATGARYRRLTAEGCDRFEGTHVLYAAGHLESLQCAEQPVVVVGGGNSAGQAAVFLSGRAAHVHILIRRDSLKETMSQYLIDRIEHLPNVTVHPKTEISRLEGTMKLEQAILDCDGQEQTLACNAIFAMIGAEPQTAWLAGCCGTDARGFVPTGRAATEHPDFRTHWGADFEGDRQPLYLETTRRGVFAIGDVRSGSVKRVATAVGEGSMVVSFVHSVLRELATAR